MKTFQFLPLAFLCTSIFIASCSNDDETQDFDCIDYEWAYVGDSNPSTWATCNVDCGGQSQSPINIAMTAPGASLSTLQTNYQEVPIDLTNNGRTVEFAYAAGSTLTLNGVDYALQQFHFHTESEHTLNGNHFPMETHLVHKNSAGDLAVVAILYEEGTENAFLDNFFDNLPETAGDDFTSPDLVNIEALFPASQAYFTYGGSLTTPPCSEAVSWFIMQNPVEASTAQINSMNDILKENNRPIQATNGRPIMAFN